MAKTGAAAEPTMEEILASIRRIISDEAEAPAAPAPKAAAQPAETHVSEDDLDKLFASGGDDIDALMAAPESADDDVLDLTDMGIDDTELQLVEGLNPDEADVAFVDPQPEDDEPLDLVEEVVEVEPPVAVAPPPPPPPRAAKPAPPPPPIDMDFEPVAEEEPLVSDQASASVNAAFGSLTHTILSAKAKTLDDLVKEMLRPMLKSWLDENLPVVVERLVRAEIERVSRGR